MADDDGGQAMTLQETKELITYIASSYPRYYRGMTRSTLEKHAAVWADIFDEYSLQTVLAGAKSYIATESAGFPPSPGQIIEHIHRKSPDKEIGGTEAWALVRKAVNVPWERMQESYDSLPKAVRKAVGSAASLKELAQMDIATFESVAQSNFLRMYKVARERIADDERTPQKVVAIREQITAELEARWAARQVETKTADVIPFPLPKAPEDPPQMDNVSEETIDRSMKRLREKLGV